MRLIHAGSFTFALVLACVLAGLAPASHVTTQANGSDTSKGLAIFRFDTFGDEQLWTNVLRMHEVIATVVPATALARRSQGRCRGAADARSTRSRR